MTSPFRLAFINSHPIQYFAPLYAHLNRDPAFDITAIYCSDNSLRGGQDPGFQQAVKWDINLLEGYKSIFLAGASHRRPQGFWSLPGEDLWNHVNRRNFDAVCVHGYGYAAYVLAILIAKLRGVRVFIRTETHLGLNRSSVRRRARDFILGLLYRCVDGFFAIGSANRQYYLTLGIPESKIFLVPYTVDNSRFIPNSSVTQRDRAEIRERFGLPQDLPVVLFASKFKQRKHPVALVHAVSLLQKEGINVALLMVGSGELDQELRALASSVGLKHTVFGGFVNQKELPRIFGACDIFVLPSESEPWGLIVNEAMCAGLPIVVGEDVGCAKDLVKEGINGYTCKPGDPNSLKLALGKLIGEPTKRKQMGQSSLSIIRDWNYDKCASGIRQAVMTYDRPQGRVDGE